MRNIILIGFFCFSSISIAQLKEPLIGIEYSTDRKENFSGFIGENSIGLFTADYIYFNKRKQELIIRNFHKGDLQLVNSKNIYSQVIDGYTNDPQEIFYQKGKFYLFSHLDSERDKTRLLGVEVFNEILEREKVVILDTLVTDEVDFIKESEDKNGFLVASHLRYSQMIEQEIDLIKVSSDGEMEWKQTIKSPMALQTLRIEKVRFSSNSPIFILCNYAYDLSGAPEVDQAVNNQYALWSYDTKGKFLKEFDIRLKNKWANGIDMQLHKDGDVIISGYFNETKNPSINGVFSMIVGADLSLKNTSWYKFNEEIFNKFYKKDDKNRDIELNDYQLKSVALLDDNSYFLLGEQYYKYIERINDPRTNVTTTTEYFNYNSIIVSYFDSLGNHKWTDRIPKFQNSTNDFGYFSSFATMNTGKDLYLFFNDSKKNNESPPSDYFGYNNLFNNMRSQISYVQLKAKGIANRDALIVDADNFTLRARLCGQLSSNEAYLMTESNRGSKIVKVEKK
ncbi:MAG: hypothetical protein R2780_10420 [Crocinitomicaceae bacterium]